MTPFAKRDLLDQMASVREALCAHQTFLGLGSFLERASLDQSLLALVWLAEYAGLHRESSEQKTLDRSALQLFASTPTHLVDDASYTLSFVMSCSRQFLNERAPQMDELLRATALLQDMPQLVAHPVTRAALAGELLLSFPPFFFLVIYFISKKNIKKLCLTIEAKPHPCCEIELQRDLLHTKNVSRGFLMHSSAAACRQLDIVVDNVLKNDAVVNEHLASGLEDAYNAVGIVEGLDVDKVHFDKYGVRRTIADALVATWNCAPLYRMQLSASASKGSPLLLKLAENALNDELHLLEVSHYFITSALLYLLVLFPIVFK